MTELDLEQTSPMESTKYIAEKFKLEVLRANKKVPLDKPVEAFDADQYKEACHYLGADFLNEKLLQTGLKIMKASRLSPNFKGFFPNGSEFYPAVIPCSDMGNLFTENEINNRPYYHLLFRDLPDPKKPENERLTKGFSFDEGHYIEMLPTALQTSCSFKVEYENGDDLTVSSKDFIRVYNAYIDSFNNLRRFFDLPPLNVEKLK